MKNILLKTEKLSKSFSNGGTMQHVLKNIDLELYQGDFTVIMRMINCNFIKCHWRCPI